jgi:phosphoribosyl-dephospho-CoA transferase
MELLQVLVNVLALSVNIHLQKEINLIKNNPTVAHGFQQENFLKLYKMLCDTEWTILNDQQYSEATGYNYHTTHTIINSTVLKKKNTSVAV